MAEEITEWLKRLNLQQYDAALKDLGAENLGDLRDLDEEEMKELVDDAKMKKLHAKKFAKAWHILKDGPSSNDAEQRMIYFYFD